MLHGNREDTAPGPPSAPRDPEELEAGRGAAAAGQVSPRTTVGPVHLTVADLERSLAYYRDQIGLDVLDRAPDAAPGSAPAETSWSCWSRSRALALRGTRRVCTTSRCSSPPVSVSPAGSLMPRATASHSSGSPTTS